MEYFLFGSALLFLGAFLKQFGAFSRSYGRETTQLDTPLYDQGSQAAEFFGAEDADVIDGRSLPPIEARDLGDDKDQLDGADKDDLAEASSGEDDFAARLGDDIALGGFGDDALTESKGADSLERGTGDDAMFSFLKDIQAATDIGEDTLLGGEGDDARHIAGGDMATGGPAADSFILDDPLDRSTTDQVTDFNPDEDVITVIYTPQTDPDTGDPVEPEISVAANHDGTAGIVWLNGVQIAQIAGGQALTAADIALIAEDA